MSVTVTQPEEQLVKALKANCSYAFTTLYELYAPTLMVILLKLIKDPERAEDLCQDAFLKIWLNIHCYQPEQGRLITWMRIITRNLAFDELKAQKVRRLAAHYLPENCALETCQSTASEGAPHQSLLDALDAKRRAVVELVHYRDYTHKEASEHLDLPLGTIKTRYRTGLQHLKAVLRQDIWHYRAQVLAVRL